LSGFGSASNVRFFWFCSPVGGVGKPGLVHAVHRGFAAERI
jgi:hypothetical protein